MIFDIYENNAYDIEQELKASYPNLNLKVLIGSVRDSKRINWVFETYKPERDLNSSRNFWTGTYEVPDP